MYVIINRKQIIIIIIYNKKNHQRVKVAFEFRFLSAVQVVCLFVCLLICLCHLLAECICFVSNWEKMATMTNDQ